MRRFVFLALGAVLACGDDGASSGGGGGGGGRASASDSGSTARASGSGAEDTSSVDATPSSTSTDATSSSLASGTSGGGGEPQSSASSSGGGGSAPEVDPCLDVPASVCDTAYPTSAGQGLVALDRCAFPMAASDDWADRDARVTALEAILPHASVEDVLGDLNRTGATVSSVPGLGSSVAYAFRWNDEDEASARWFPQGLTGSPDADPSGLVASRRVVLASFYDASEDDATNKGARVAFADVTGPGAPTYRYALLVDVTGSAAAVDIAPVPTHAGGMVWVGHWLYVADTRSGFRVFDTDRMMQVDTDVDAIGCDATGCTAGLYKYVIPQVGAFVDASRCEPIFSFVALDPTSDPPALVSGEYCSGDACASPLASRLFRWPLDPATGLLAADRVWPTDAWFMGETQVQGGITIEGTAFLSSSAPAAGAGELYRATADGSDALPWSDSPEDLLFDPTAGWLWGLSEAVDARFVYAVEADTLAP